MVITILRRTASHASQLQRRIVRGKTIAIWISPLIPSSSQTALSWSISNLKKFSLGLVLFLSGSKACFGQALPTAESRMDVGIFVTGGLMNTQLPMYSDNALGANVGLFIQPNRFVGLEVRGGAYPYSARFVQEPITAGFRLSSRASLDWHSQFFAYFGGGESRAEDEAGKLKPTAPQWDPCWQGSVGIDLPFRRWKFRLFEANWTETYTPQRTLRSLSVNSGLIYTFRH